MDKNCFKVVRTISNNAVCAARLLTLFKRKPLLLSHSLVASSILIAIGSLISKVCSTIVFFSVLHC